MYIYIYISHAPNIAKTLYHQTPGRYEFPTTQGIDSQTRGRVLASSSDREIPCNTLLINGDWIDSSIPEWTR